MPSGERTIVNVSSSLRWHKPGSPRGLSFGGRLRPRRVRRLFQESFIGDGLSLFPMYTEREGIATKVTSTGSAFARMIAVGLSGSTEFRATSSVLMNDGLFLCADAVDCLVFAFAWA